VATTDVPPSETVEDLVTEACGEDAEGPRSSRRAPHSKGRADWGIDGSGLVIGGGDEVRPGNSAVHSLAVTIAP
jgi:hypothetical protein